MDILYLLKNYLTGIAHIDFFVFLIALFVFLFILGVFKRWLFR